MDMVLNYCLKTRHKKTPRTGKGSYVLPPSEIRIDIKIKLFFRKQFIMTEKDKTTSWVYDKIPFSREYRKYGLLNGQVLLKPPVLVPSKKV